MSQTGIGYIDQTARSNWIKLRTLVMVRWFAIAGQSLALIVAWSVLGLQLPFAMCLLAIGASVVFNTLSTLSFPDNRRLSEVEAVAVLLFDILQLCFLLALTGGLSNPFALLILAPVGIAASALPSRLTLLLGAAAIAMITLVWRFHVPLQTGAGLLVMPPIFAFGFWASIVIGVTFLAIYTRRVTEEMTSMAQALLATQMALAREQKLTDLGGVVAATAHELGTPLATITLVSAELMEELDNTSDLHADAKLIREQADRCKNILQTMGRAGKDDLHMRTAPWPAVIEEAAEPHMNRGAKVLFHIDHTAPGNLPNTRRTPEVVHGIRNIIQNAVDFAQVEVNVTIGWTRKNLTLQIADDGQGYPPQVISRLGDPFVRQRQNAEQRAGYEGMGLGLFIAKTLLERSGATLSFRNSVDPERPGAIVDIVWSRSDLEDVAFLQGENPSNTLV